jgi:hypothetical protein
MTSGRTKQAQASASSRSNRLRPLRYVASHTDDLPGGGHAHLVMQVPPCIDGPPKAQGARQRDGIGTLFYLFFA